MLQDEDRRKWKGKDWENRASAISVTSNRDSDISVLRKWTISLKERYEKREHLIGEGSQLVGH